MSELSDNTLTAYLGPEFQQRLIWQLLVEPEFAEKAIRNIAIEYFDDPNLKRLFIIMLEYYKEFDKVPNLQNQSIHQAINKYKTPNNIVEEESLFSIIKRIEMWNERIINKQMLYDGDVVQKSTNSFVKQQEYRKLAENVLEKVRNGEIKNKNIIAGIEEKFQKISHIGEESDDSESVTEGISKALRKEFRETIPTGVETIDVLTGGGLGKGEMGIVLTPSGVGKALPVSAKLLTPNGWILNGNVKIDDLVIGSDGKPQKVLGVYPQGKRQIYKILFNDNTIAYCDYEHIWSVNSLNQRTANTTKHINGNIIHEKRPDNSYKNKTTGELLKDYIINNKSGKKLNYRIPIVKPIHFNNIETSIHPYIMGVMLGDGYMRAGEFTTSDVEIIDNVKKFYNNITVNKDKRTNNVFRVRLCNSINDLKKYDLFDRKSNNKFIPDVYKYNSIENRILLLNGLLDTDGFASKNGRVQYTTTSEQLASDVRELVLSLGGFCKIKTKIPKYKYLNNIKSGKQIFTLTISFTDENIEIFKLNRKQCLVKYCSKYKNNKYISSIEYSHDEDALCIYVENDDHLYVTDDYILTHNTTLLTVIANTAYEHEKNVAQIIFEDTKDQIKRKHYTIWAKSALSRLNEDGENERVIKVVNEKIKQLEGKGRLIIKRFSQEDTTMRDIRNWMISYEKKWGFKFDLLVLDYLDCVESHKNTQDRNESELTVVKAFEALASDFNIPAWTAIQTNRTGFGSEFIEAHQSGGNIKRIQKAHFFMSVAKTKEQQEAHLANIRIIKARFAKDGQGFEDCVYNNDTIEIRIDDPKYKYSKTYKGLKHHNESDIDNLDSSLNKIHLAVSDYSEKSIIDKVNNYDLINELLHQNSLPEKVKDLTIKNDINTKFVNIDETFDVINDEFNNNDNETSSNLLDIENNIQSDIKIIDEDVVEFELPINNIVEESNFILPKTIVVESSINNAISDNIDDIMNLINLTDPDEHQDEYKTIFNELEKKRSHQKIIKD
jgi:replicative DNA helicase